METYLVDAFTTRRFEGNRAGVVFNADELTREEKQLIASEIGASETVFVQQSDKADYKMEFFTPTTEVNFCGHASIAAFYMLAESGKIGVNGLTVHLTQQSKAGILPFELSKSNGRIYVTMTQRKPEFENFSSSPTEIAKALNISTSELDDRYPPGLSNTGNWHLMIAVKSKEILNKIQYDSALLSQILSEANAITAHIFAIGDKNGNGEQRNFHARNFCPTIGIPEDPATGAAAGAFIAYLSRGGFFADGAHEIKILQGEAMGRPSQIIARVKTKNREVEEVQVSGTAELSFQLTSKKA